jgi:large subunit ribosomal protein L6
MSRIGKKPISVPEKTEVTIADGNITVQGKNGSLSLAIHPDVEIEIEDNLIKILQNSRDRKKDALQGMVRSLVQNMVTGVSQGFERILEINGIGYRAESKGNTLLLNLGYSHPINFQLPDGIAASVEKNNIIKLTGIDKHLIGQTAARIRQLRPPEPYKGKGIKYQEEFIQRKAGKTGTK